jgi:hypothetical protein
MTAEELTLEILDRRNVSIREKDYWTCFEVNEKEEAGRWPWAAFSPTIISPAPCRLGARGSR